jgi:competence protein ComEC
MRSRNLKICLCLGIAVVLQAQSGNLNIYFIDVEGGAATLTVTPSGQSLLVDTGNPSPTDRDAKRIFEAAQLAGIKKIDAVIITHYHGDHSGGVVALSKLIPIDKFYDHGDSAEAAGNPRAAQMWEAYKGVADGKRVIVKPGDKIPLKGVDVTVVSSNGKVIEKPITPGVPNPLCKDTQQKEPDPTQPENFLSVGTLLTYGKFKFLNLGDLTWDRELMLACPVNKIGTITLFQATHHGFYNEWSGPPAFVWALKPQVVIVENGPTKGLPAGGYEVLAKIPGVEGIWQGHRAVRNDDAHNTSESMIANLATTQDETKGNWMKASVSKDGTFTVTNSRNDLSKTYTIR